MERKKYLILTAGGTGTRMGASIPKQFLQLGGQPILRQTLDRFLEAEPSLKILTVLPEAHMDWWREYCLKHNYNCPQRLVKGGFTRFHSVKNALAHIPDGALVAVHDGVRPLVSVAFLQRLFEAAQEVPALVPVMPVTDTLKVLERQRDGSLAATGEQADRSRIFGAQTPQLFHSELLKAAYTQAYSTSFTDDASVVESYGGAICYCEGERFNLKITTPEDLELAQALNGKNL